MKAQKGFSCQEDWGNFARWQAIALNHSSKYIDTGCFHKHEEGGDIDYARDCAVRAVDGSNPCHGLPRPPPPDADMVAVSEHVEDYMKEAIPQEHFSKYRYLLNLPGAKSGSYSRNLNVLWNSGSVVLLWDAPFVEWYFPALSHGRTHLAVVYNTASKTIESVEANPRVAHDLVKNALEIHQTFLCPSCIRKSTMDVLRALHQHFGMDLILNNNTAPGIFKQMNSNKLLHCEDLVEFHMKKERKALQSTDVICGGEV
uniref:Glycosyl transferase CAP10 domain-containing protein n=1 Tax=Paramoeba aestuarina TaxID=180227 RepID=A0A7S4PFL5_9EUKA